MNIPTNNQYYKQKLFLAQTDKDDNIIGQVERWEAHEKGILHRAFTAILLHEGKVLLQHRKHPAFDGLWDLTFSSHQLYEGDRLQSDLEAINNTLLREWNLETTDLAQKPKYIGKVYYEAKDRKSVLMDHEFDYVYVASLKRLPSPNFDYCYGFEVVNDVEEIYNNPQFNQDLAPWVEKIIEELDLPRELSEF